MDQRLIDLYDDYTHARIDRRRFLDRLAALTGSLAAGLALVRSIAADPAVAVIVPSDDARLAAGYVAYPGPDGKEIRAYRAAPKDAAGALPGVLVVHENRGLNGHIEDVARRAALGGFVALAPDLLSPLGATPAGDEDRAREMIGRLDPAAATAAAGAGVTWLAGQPGGNGRVGVVGFCWGGGVANRVAAANPRGLAAAVAFYGRPLDAAAVPGVKVPLLLHYAGLDRATNAGIPEFRQALDAAGVRYELYVYEGVNHAFHNDTAGERYAPEAARLAWERTIEFLKRNTGVA